METFVAVRWEWLALLVAQVCLAIVILVFVVVATARSGVAVVKSSPLPGLFAISGEEKLWLEATPTTAADMAGIQRARGEVALMSTAAGITGGLRRRGQLWEIR